MWTAVLVTPSFAAESGPGGTEWGALSEDAGSPKPCRLLPSPTLPAKCGTPAAASETPSLHPHFVSSTLGSTPWETQTTRTLAKARLGTRCTVLEEAQWDLPVDSTLPGGKMCNNGKCEPTAAPNTKKIKENKKTKPAT